MTATPWPDGKRAAVSLTFDDARWSQAQTGLPLLNALGVRATFYVSLPGVHLRVADWQQAAMAGHEIGNHTLSHPCSGNFSWARANALEEYDLNRMQAELEDADREIETLLGVVPRTFAYPCGQKFVGRGIQTQSYVPLIAERFLAGRGFRDEALNDPAFCDLAQLAGVDFDAQTFEFCRGWLDRALAEGGWLVFAGHDVGKSGHQTVDLTTLETLCRFCLAPENGLWLATVAEVGDCLQAFRASTGRN